MRILLMESNPFTGEFLRKTLSKAGYDIHLITLGLLNQCVTPWHQYDLIILDEVGLKQSAETWTSLGSQPHYCPILAIIKVDYLQSQKLDCIDDYLVKPYVYSELLLRIRRLILARKGIVHIAGLAVNFQQGVAVKSGRLIKLDMYQYARLEHLAFNIEKRNLESKYDALENHIP